MQLRKERNSVAYQFRGLMTFLLCIAVSISFENYRMVHPFDSDSSEDEVDWQDTRHDPYRAGNRPVGATARRFIRSIRFRERVCFSGPRSSASLPKEICFASL